MSDTHFDVIVLGAGPGGYLAAERLGHAGKKVALVEEQYLGGTCLNVGCIPTKTLLNGAKNYLHAKEASQFGVDASGVAVNWTQMQAWKDQVVKGLVAGVAATERKAGVTVINGRGHLDAPGRVTVKGTTYTSDHVIIATGSVPAMPRCPAPRTIRRWLTLRASCPCPRSPPASRSSAAALSASSLPPCTPPWVRR